MNPFVFWEAIKSTALSHGDGHDCDICKAAMGNADARNRVLLAVFEADERQRREPKEGSNG